MPSTVGMQNVKGQMDVGFSAGHLQPNRKPQPLVEGWATGCELSPIEELLTSEAEIETPSGIPRVTSGTISGMLADFNRQMAKLSASDPAPAADQRAALLAGQPPKETPGKAGAPRKFSLDSHAVGLGGSPLASRHAADAASVAGPQTKLTDALPVQPLKHQLERLVSPVIDQTMQQQQLLIQQQQQLIILQKEQNKLQQQLQGKKV